jgi:hypothetical protein
MLDETKAVLACPTVKATSLFPFHWASCTKTGGMRKKDATNGHYKTIFGSKVATLAT